MNRSALLRTICFVPTMVSAVVLLLHGVCALPSRGAERPNVLFIGVDDLRPEMDCYGVEKMVTPNLNRLAERGVRFDRAYCNIAVCGGSRASLMKGLRPTPTRFTSYLTRADKDAPDVPSLPLVFKQHGYHTASNGKVYHHVTDDPQAWSQPAWRPGKSSIWWALPENRNLATGGICAGWRSKKSRSSWPAVSIGRICRLWYRKPIGSCIPQAR